MKGKTILGVVLTLMLLSSLLVVATPVSAGTLSWSDETIPTTDDQVLRSGDVLDVAVADDGMTIYAAVGVAELQTGPDGIAEWSAEEQVSGSYSAYLSDNGTGYTSSTNYGAGRVVLSNVNIALDDIDTLSYWFNYDDPVAAYPYAFPYMILACDTKAVEAELDGVVDSWIVLFTSESTYWQPAENTWLQWDSTNSTIDHWIGFGDLAGKVAEDSSLATFQADTDLDDAVVLAVKVAVGEWHTGSYTAIIGYVDDIAINGSTYNLEPASVVRSTDAGVSWSVLSSPDGVDNTITLVAVAPDDANYIAIVADDDEVHVSDDAGATWDALPAIVTDNSSTELSANITDLAVSAEKSDKHYVAVTGTDNASVANVFYYAVGASVPEWTETKDKSGFTAGTVAAAVAFSPNFPSDEVMVVVTADTGANSVDFQIYSYDSSLWNSAAAFPDDYPVNIAVSGDDITSLDSASISLAPDYLGSDSDLRLAFVGVTVNGDNATELESSGLFRLEDDSEDALKDEVHIHSVAYDGTNLVAGRYDGTTVYRCVDPLASSPSVKSSSSLKQPGGENRVVVAWAGDEVVAGTTGANSAFAVSGTDGKTFNDISLIDTALSDLTDIAVSADGSNVYLATDDGSYLSLWRYASDWVRVFSLETTSNFIVRTAPEDADVVYVAESDGTAIYYSADAGETRWQVRTCTVDVQDLAVESPEVVYVLESGVGGNVATSTNSGFTWSTAVASKLTQGNMLVSLGEDLLLAGSTDGYVSYSTDGNTSWTKLDEDIGNTVQVIASGLTTDDFVYAGTDLATDTDIYRWDWEDEEWDAIYEAVSITDYITGIALQDGVLYVVSANTTGSQSYRTLDPTSDDPTWSTMPSVGENFTALRASGVSSNMMWVISENTSELFSYTDTIMDVGPGLVLPVHGFSDRINPVTGRAMDVTFVWEKPSSKVEGYDLRIALDEGFDEVLRTIDVASDDDVISQIAGPHGSTAADADVEFMPETTYYWKVRVNDPIYSPWSIVYTLTVEEALAPFPEVTVEAPPAPEVTVTAPPAPEVTVTVPPAPAPITPAPAIPAILLWTIIIIGAVLIIALIVLIVRTRRVV